jgi:hypothetical protein
MSVVSSSKIATNGALAISRLISSNITSATELIKQFLIRFDVPLNLVAADKWFANLSSYPARRCINSI